MLPDLHPTPVLLYGASGHTGRFIVDALVTAGFRPVLSGRDRRKLEGVSAARGGLEVRAAPLDDPRGLDRALEGAAAIINAAGPFADTAAPLAGAALCARLPYLDVAAETDVAAATVADFGAGAAAAGVALVPATGFYGGLGNLLATAAMGDWRRADEITLAYALSSWKPTAGTRATIAAGAARRAGRRLVFARGRLELREDEAPVAEWTFSPPVGKQAVVAEFTTADSVTIPRHLQIQALSEFMTLAPLADLADPDPAPPAAADALGRSSQTFQLEAVVRLGAQQRSACARGRDIYAVSAPLVVEALKRVLQEPGRWRGVVTAAELGDARSFLAALAPRHLDWELHPGAVQGGGMVRHSAGTAA